MKLPVLSLPLQNRRSPYSDEGVPSVRSELVNTYSEKEEEMRCLPDTGSVVACELAFSCPRRLPSESVARVSDIEVGKTDFSASVKFDESDNTDEHKEISAQCSVERFASLEAIN